MKILKISHHYPAYLEHLRKNIFPLAKTYREALDQVMKDSFSWADFYQVAFQKLGHEVIEIIHNFDELQALYALEKGTNNRGLDLLTEQVKDVKPDLIYLDTLNVPPSWLKMIKETVPSVRKIGIFNCSPGSANGFELFKICDFIITCNEHINRGYKKMGLNSFQIFHAFDAAILPRLKQNPVKDQILFSGSLFPGSDFHDERTKVLEGLVRLNLPLVGYASLDSTPDWKIYLKRQIFLTAKALAYVPGNPLGKWQKFKNLQNTKNIPTKLHITKELRSKLQGPLFGLNMYQAMADSLVTFNIHGGISGNFAANMRMFETTGVGSCLLTDKKDDLHTLFDLDNEIVTYSSSEECIEKAAWLINNPKKAREIGLAGQKRTLKDHNYLNRAEQLIKIFEM